MELLTINNLLIFFFLFIVIDCIIRFIYSKYFENETNTNTNTNTNKQEHFTENISSQQVISSILPAQKFIHYQYVNSWKNDIPVIKRNSNDYPILRMSIYPSNSYDVDIYDYFRHNIYPVNKITTLSNLNTLQQFQNNLCDMAFISEEILMRYFNIDCRIFNNLWQQLTHKTHKTHKTQEIVTTTKEIDINKQNISSLGIGYYEYMYFIIRNRDRINAIDNVLSERIGICSDDYYYFIKLLSMKSLDINNIKLTITSEVSELIKQFKNNDLDAIFIVTHPKNDDLRDLSRNIQIKFLPIINDSDSDGDNSGNYISNIKKYFATAIIRIEDLNKFYRYGNIFSKSAYKTIAIRTILVINNKVSDKSVKFLLNNYIDSLVRLRNYIDKKEYKRLLNNFEPRDFNYDEMVSMHSSIPLHYIARDKYIETGLITLEEELQCKIQNT